MPATPAESPLNNRRPLGAAPQLGGASRGSGAASSAESDCSIRADRRISPRLPLSLSAHCQVGAEYTRGQVVDVSRSGLGLAIEHAWPEGTQVRVALTLPHREGPKFCTLDGKVVRARPGGVGVHLDERPSGDRDALQGFVALLGMQRQLQF